MNGKRRMYLWPDMLWLALALAVMLAGCAAVAAMDTYEEGVPQESAIIMVEHGLTDDQPDRDDAATVAVSSDLPMVDKPVEVPRPANPWGVPLYDEELEALYETCEAYRMAPELGLSLIWVESRYDREAVNGACYGLCQLKEKYFPGASSMTGAENIRAGMNRLGELLEEYDNLDAALCAYRWGSDNGDRHYAGEVLAKREEFAEECY